MEPQEQIFWQSVHVQPYLFVTYVYDEEEEASEIPVGARITYKQPRRPNPIESLFDIIHIGFDLIDLEPELIDARPDGYLDVLKHVRNQAVYCAPALAHQIVNYDTLSTETLERLIAEYNNHKNRKQPDGLRTIEISIDRDKWLLDGLTLAESIIQKRYDAIRPNGYVYLLKSVTGYWKIGRTVNPQDRIRTFSVKLPFEVEYEHIIPCVDHVRAELELHERFASKRTNGEWFCLDENEVAYIKSLKRL